MSYAKLENGNIVHAPNNLLWRGVLYGAPTGEQYLEAGWKRIVDNPPAETPEGKIAVPSGWSETETEIVRAYEVVDAPPPPPKTYSKYRLGVAVQNAGLIEPLMAYFAANPVAKFHWDNAQDFVSDDPNFVSLVEVFNSQFGADAVAAALAEAEVG